MGGKWGERWERKQEGRYEVLSKGVVMNKVHGNQEEKKIDKHA